MHVQLEAVTVEGRARLQLASEQHSALTGQLVEARTARRRDAHTS